MDPQQLENSILFEDDALIVLNKPAGWVVNRSHTYKELTVQDWMEGKIAPALEAAKASVAGEVKPVVSEDENDYGSPEEIFLQRGGVVHRLDKDTSGVLLLAKRPDVLVELMRQLREREVEKTYLALVHGKLIPADGLIRLPMDRSPKNIKKFAVGVDGKMSETAYTMRTFYPQLPNGISGHKGKIYQGFSLVELRPKTGRTHQIRVHMSAISHPLVSDETYGGRKRLPIDVQWCPRHFLHAEKIQFVHPLTKQPMTIDAPLSADLAHVLSLFEN